MTTNGKQDYLWRLVLFIWLAVLIASVGARITNHKDSESTPVAPDPPLEAWYTGDYMQNTNGTLGTIYAMQDHDGGRAVVWITTEGQTLVANESNWIKGRKGAK